MSGQVAGDSVGARILLLLGERHPITEREVALALGLRADVVRREVKRLVAQGLVVRETLDDKVYVALSGQGITYLGLPPAQVRRLRERRLPPPKPRDDTDPAFG